MRLTPVFRDIRNTLKVLNFAFHLPFDYTFPNSVTGLHEIKVNTVSTNSRTSLIVRGQQLSF